MTGLRISFSLLLENYGLPDFLRPVGPLFHRWVPDGANDALNLSAADEPDQLAVWFERRAKNPGGFLKWDPHGTEFDPSIMKRQAKLDGGFLRGELLLMEIPDDQRQALEKDPKRKGEPFGGEPIDEDAAYVALAKRIISSIQPRVTRFIDVLRGQYGQYWLRELHPWDSRRATLGGYCSQLSLCWWSEARQEWYRVLPTQLGHTIPVERPPGRGYAEYLTEEDWRRLQSSRCLDDISLDLHLLGQATRLLDVGDYRQAFVEGVSALEVAVSRVLRSPEGPEAIRSALQAFTDRVPFKTRATVILRLRGVSSQELEDALKAIDLRNRAVHEGYRVTLEDTRYLRQLMMTASRFAGNEELKIPSLDSGNSLSPPGGPIVELGVEPP